MTRKLVGYSTVGTNNKEKAEEFYNAIFSFIDAERFSDPTDDRITFWMRDGGKEFLHIKYLQAVKIKVFSVAQIK